MTNNQTKCGVIYEKITMRASDDERMNNYEWLYQALINFRYKRWLPLLQIKIITSIDLI